MPSGHDQCIQVGRIALQCDDCGHVIEVDVAGRCELRVHDELRNRVAVGIVPDVDAMQQAVVRHTDRGCPATHFTQCEVSDAHS